MQFSFYITTLTDSPSGVDGNTDGEEASVVDDTCNMDGEEEAEAAEEAESAEEDEGVDNDSCCEETD